ncbi:MAG TPA: hypothetical protein VGP47_00575 [Parachlamydiaceae bacterium]|nr:hypothetical protein [Parachlamydiaceae bacterium]
MITNNTFVTINIDIPRNNDTQPLQIYATSQPELDIILNGNKILTDHSNLKPSPEFKIIDKKVKRITFDDKSNISEKRTKLSNDNKYKSFSANVIDTSKALSANECFASANEYAAEGADQSKVIELYKKALKLSNNENEKADIHYNLALFYQEQGEFGSALSEWKELSKLPAGWKAFNNIGVLYLNGYEGVEKNYATALKYFKKGAEQGDNDADFNIALTWDNMRDNAEDVATRQKYRQLAVENYKRIGNYQPSSHTGAVAAQFNAVYLSHLDVNGAFAPVDLKAATAIYKKLARVNSEDCRIPLFRAFVAYHIGNKYNPVKDANLLKFLEEAAAKGSDVAHNILQYKDTPRFGKKIITQMTHPQSAYLE